MILSIERLTDGLGLQLEWLYFSSQIINTSSYLLVSTVICLIEDTFSEVNFSVETFHPTVGASLTLKTLGGVPPHEVFG